MRRPEADASRGGSIAARARRWLSAALSFFRGVHAPIAAERRLSAFMLQEEQRALYTAAYVRFVFVAMLLLIEAVGMVMEDIPLEHRLHSLLIKLAFLPAGVVQLRLASVERYRPWVKHLLLAADVGLLAFYLAIPNPIEHPVASGGFVEEALRYYQNQTLKWLWLFYVWVMFSFSAGYVRVFSAYVALAWIAQLLWVLSLPGVFHQWSVPEALIGLTREELRYEYGFVDIGLAADGVLETLFMAVGFVYAAANSRRLVSRFFAAEERRSALSRFLSPNLVDRLERADAPPPRQRSKAAILFVDIKGFTGLVRGETPDAVLDLLQEFHARAEAIIFEREGTLEKYIGDAALAVFGQPEPRSDDPDRALACALALLAAMEDWNAERRARGEPPVRVGIGLDYGDVVGGVIGRRRNMSYAVVGEAVNAASRLQGLTRDWEADLVFSERFRAALSDETQLSPLGDVARHEGARLRGLEDQDAWSARSGN